MKQFDNNVILLIVNKLLIMISQYECDLHKYILCNELVYIYLILIVGYILVLK